MKKAARSKSLISALYTGQCASAQRNNHDLTPYAVKNVGLRAGGAGRSSISGVTATVFGCTGFLGRYVVNALAKHGSQVVIPYRADETMMSHLRVMGDLGQIVQYRDFNSRNDEHIRDAIKRSNIVINCIGLDKETWNFSFEDVHVDIARRIAQAAAENPLTERVVHLSCLGAEEDAPSRRLRSKAAGEAAVREAFPGATIFKVAAMVGTEDRLFNNYAQLAKTLPFIPLIDGGHQRLQPVWVRDVSDAVGNALRSRATEGQTYHLAGPEQLSVKEIVNLVFDTIREQRRAVPLPMGLAKLLATPREMIFRTVPILVNHLFTMDYILEAAGDQLLPEGEGILTFADLDIVPRRVTAGMPIEHVRHYRSGGYDLGTTNDMELAGGPDVGGAPGKR